MIRDKFSYHEDEDKILDDLREWSLQYFNQVFIFDAETIVPTQKKVDINDQIYFKNFDIHGKIVFSQKKTEKVQVEELEDEQMANPVFEDQDFLYVVVQDIHGLNFESKIPIIRFRGFSDYERPLKVEKIFSVGKVMRIRSAKLHSTLNDIISNRVTPSDSIILKNSKKVYHLDFESQWGQ